MITTIAIHTSWTLSDFNNFLDFLSVIYGDLTEIGELPKKSDNLYLLLFVPILPDVGDQ